MILEVRFTLLCPLALAPAIGTAFPPDREQRRETLDLRPPLVGQRAGGPPGLSQVPAAPGQPCGSQGPHAAGVGVGGAGLGKEDHVRQIQT